MLSSETETVIVRRLQGRTSQLQAEVHRQILVLQGPSLGRLTLPAEPCHPVTAVVVQAGPEALWVAVMVPVDPVATVPVDLPLRPVQPALQGQPVVAEARNAEDARPTDRIMAATVGSGDGVNRPRLLAAPGRRRPPPTLGRRALIKSVATGWRTSLGATRPSTKRRQQTKRHQQVVDPLSGEWCTTGTHKAHRRHGRRLHHGVHRRGRHRDRQMAEASEFRLDVGCRNSGSAIGPRFFRQFTVSRIREVFWPVRTRAGRSYC